VRPYKRSRKEETGRICEQEFIQPLVEVFESIPKVTIFERRSVHLECRAETRGAGASKAVLPDRPEEPRKAGCVSKGLLNRRDNRRIVVEIS
jgi:hypothetical protein